MIDKIIELTGIKWLIIRCLFKKFLLNYVLFLHLEGSPDDNEFSQQILKPCAEVLYSQIPSASFLQTLKSASSSNNKDESCSSLNQLQQLAGSVSGVAAEFSNHSDLANDDHKFVIFLLDHFDHLVI